jgi:hypothetical protein
MQEDEEYNSYLEGVEFMERMRLNSSVFLNKNHLSKEDLNSLGLTSEELKNMGFDFHPNVMILGNYKEFEKTTGYNRMISSAKAFTSEFELYFSRLQDFRILPEYCPIKYRTMYKGDFLKFIKRNFFTIFFLGKYFVHFDYAARVNLDIYELAAISKVILENNVRKTVPEEHFFFIKQCFLVCRRCYLDICLKF